MESVCVNSYLFIISNVLYTLLVHSSLLVLLCVSSSSTARTAQHKHSYREIMSMNVLILGIQVRAHDQYMHFYFLLQFYLTQEVTTTTDRGLRFSVAVGYQPAG